MLLINDIRESRFYQEVKAEVIDEERARYLQEKLESVARMAALKMAPNQIAEILKLDLDLVRREMAKLP